MIDVKPGFIDIHAHLLPIQDGPDNMEQAIDAVRIAENSNIAAMILTPHYSSGDNAYSKENVEEVFGRLKERINKEKIKVNLFLGNECVVDEKIFDAIKRKKAYTLNQTEYVLVEYPFYQVPCDFQSILYQLMDNGYKPIIAHPERNSFIETYLDSILELRENGCMIQINAESILGKYGRLCKKYAVRILKNRQADIIASDAHSTKSRTPANLKKAYDKVRRFADEKYISDLFINNPGITIT